MALSKNTIKYLKSLHLKKFRQKYDKFMVEGDKMARELLLQKEFVVEELYAVEPWLKSHFEKNVGSTLHAITVSEAELRQISSLTTPNQVVAVVRMPKYNWQEASWSNWVFYLDGIQDPGNLGAILRIADWFGIHPVFCSPSTTEVFNAKVIQASMGAFLRVPTVEIKLEDLLKLAEGRPAWGADLNGEDAFSTSWPEKGVLVIGSEGGGLSQDSTSLIASKVTIPKGSQGGAESLNAAVATGILCAAFFKQHRNL